MKKYVELFLTMLKIGLFTFGGGYAMIALLENEFVSKKKWINHDVFFDMVAIAESTPGPIAINAATYIGYTYLGFGGSLVATIAVCIPSFFIIYTISLFFDAFLSLSAVAYAFKGIQVCVIYLILSAGINLLRGLKRDFFQILIIVVVMAAMILTSLFAVNFSTIYYILLSGVAGIFIYVVREIREKEEK